MELNESLLNEIRDAFRKVEHGRITFFLAPEKKTLDFTVETSHKLTLKDFQENPNKLLTRI